ncbi:MAG: polyprenyl synthetase family protein [Candidatus Bathyarchaeota archaeon]
MSELLLRELDLASEEVNATINGIFGNIREPKVIYDAAKHLIHAGGKRLRPFLTLKACEIVGGRREDAFSVAASIELIHNFTIIHDDIMDEDSRRRGVPTVHVLWGVPMAINAGDMLFARAYKAVLRCKVPPKRLLKIIATITDATIGICEGQALDMLFEERKDVSEMEYLSMIYKKTAVLLEAAAMSGALVGGGTALQVKRLGNLSSYAGLAFQMIDDILGLTANEKVLGKPVGNDIREGKSTILIIHALTHANGNQRKQILSVLGNKEAEKNQIQNVIQTIKSLGSVEYATKKAEEYVVKAKAQLSSFSPSQSKDILIDLCDYIASRSY